MAGLDAEFVVAASQILDERMTNGNWTTRDVEGSSIVRRRAISLGDRSTDNTLLLVAAADGRIATQEPT